MITVKKKVEKKEIECAYCHTVLEYEPSDIHDVYEGLGFTCPECGEDIVVEEKIDDRPIYPAAFFKFGNGYKTTNDEIQEWCDRVFDDLKESEELFRFRSIGSGDTIVIGHKNEDREIDIIVAKNYEEFNYFPDDYD